MTNDFFFGILISMPIYAIAILLFRDIIIDHFLRAAIIKTVPMEDSQPMFSTKDMDDAFLQDILTSYRLMLIIYHEFTFLNTKVDVGQQTRNILTHKLEYITDAINEMEKIFEERNCKEYLKVKEEILELVNNIPEM